MNWTWIYRILLVYVAIGIVMAIPSPMELFRRAKRDTNGLFCYHACAATRKDPPDLFTDLVPCKPYKNELKDLQAHCSEIVKSYKCMEQCPHGKFRSIVFDYYYPLEMATCTMIERIKEISDAEKKCAADACIKVVSSCQEKCGVKSATTTSTIKPLTTEPSNTEPDALADKTRKELAKGFNDVCTSYMMCFTECSVKMMRDGCNATAASPIVATEMAYKEVCNVAAKDVCLSGEPSTKKEIAKGTAFTAAVMAIWSGSVF